jgi:hypothetical protein
VQELDELSRKIDGLYDAIADGLRTPGLTGRLAELEVRKAELEIMVLQKADPVRQHPNLSKIYRRTATALSCLLGDAAIRQPALDGLRSLIEAVVVHVAGDQTRLEVQGALTAMLDLIGHRSGGSIDVCLVKVVAGAGFEPAAFRL